MKITNRVQHRASSSELWDEMEILCSLFHTRVQRQDRHTNYCRRYCINYQVNEIKQVPGASSFAALLVDLSFRSFSHSSMRVWIQELPAEEPSQQIDFKVSAGQTCNPSSWKDLQLLHQVVWLDPVQFSVCACIENEMMSRAGNSASSSSVRRPNSLSLAAGTSPKLGLNDLKAHFAFCQSTFKLLSLHGGSSCNCIPLDPRLWKKARTSNTCSQSPSRAAGRLLQKHFPGCCHLLHRD